MFFFYLSNGGDYLVLNILFRDNALKTFRVRRVTCDTDKYLRSGLYFEMFIHEPGNGIFVPFVDISKWEVFHRDI